MTLDRAHASVNSNLMIRRCGSQCRCRYVSWTQTIRRKPSKAVV